MTDQDKDNTPPSRDQASHRCGMVAVVGRPNVGKSTLVNQAIGQKICITARKPQTTRHRILGIKTQANAQIVYVDTPGLQVNPKFALNRFMNQQAVAAVDGVDVIVFMVQACKWTPADGHVLKKIKGLQTPILLVPNKVDRVQDKSELLPFIEHSRRMMDYAEIVPISARNGQNVPDLERSIIRLLPVGAPIFANDQVTNRSERFLAGEIIREKLVRKLGDEIPFRLGVVVDEFQVEDDLTRISVVIWVERDGQKRIVIGRKGTVLKDIGQQARKDIEQMLGAKVFLQTWVKVKGKCSDEAMLHHQLGYSDPLPKEMKAEL